MTVTAPLGARGDEDVLESGQGRPLEPATSGTAESWQRRSRKAKINLDKVKQTKDKQRKLRIFIVWKYVLNIAFCCLIEENII